MDSTHWPLIRFLYYTNMVKIDPYDKFIKMSICVVVTYGLGKMSLGCLR